jgi:hypothetical protein
MEVADESTQRHPVTFPAWVLQAPRTALCNALVVQVAVPSYGTEIGVPPVEHRGDSPGITAARVGRRVRSPTRGKRRVADCDDAMWPIAHSHEACHM